jgi:hypothetical protein
MAFYSTITAADGLALEVCVPGPALPSSLDVLEYVNPRTGNVERTQSQAAWAGDQDTPPDPERATLVTVVG